MSVKTSLRIRPYEESDEAKVLDLLIGSLGGGPGGRRPPEFFRWKHLDNPFGRSFMLVGEIGDRIVGFRSFMRWTFVAGGRPYRCVRAVDTATHSDARGQGIFTCLTKAALEVLRDEVGFVFNTPNHQSLPGYLKMGWKRVANVPILVRIRRPLRFGLSFVPGSSRGVPPAPEVSAPHAGVVLQDRDRIQGLLREIENSGDRLATPRGLEYLSWRYASAPLLDYRAVTLNGRAGVDGLAFFRTRPRNDLWETTVAEILVRPGDRASAASLLRKIVRAARVDHVTCSFPSDSTPLHGARRAAFLPSPRGPVFVVNPLSDQRMSSPETWSSWALSLGDVEVF